MKIVIIGGVAGGASAAARLRRLNESDEIIILEKGNYISFANCGLPYYVGEVITSRDSLLLMTPELMKSRFNIDVRINNEVIALNKEKNELKVKNLKENKEYIETFDKLIIASGSSPIKPNIPGIESKLIKKLWTIDDVDEIKELVSNESIKNICVIGGGFIGLEMVENLKEIKKEVTLIEAQEQVMKNLDFELAEVVKDELLENDVKVYLNSKVDSFKEINNKILVKVNSLSQELEFDLVILSIGVKPNSSFLNDSGVELNEKGAIKTNEYLETSRKDVYAVGDAIEVNDYILNSKTNIPLAGPANKEGRIVANNINGAKEKYKGSLGTSIMKLFNLSIAATGKSEAELKRNNLIKGVDYETILINQNSHASYYPNSTPMFIKLIFSLDGKKIYGGEIVGTDAVDKRIDTLASTIRLNGTIFDLKELELAYAPPFSSAKDPINMAGFVAENVINSLVKFSSYNLNEYQKEEVILLDVREKEELLAFEINGAINIPLGKLRESLSSLDKSKKIIVFCAVGVRSYNGARILMQNGFKDVLVYPGGVRLFKYLNIAKESPSGGNFSSKLNKANFDANEEKVIKMSLDCSGLQCPGPIMKVYEAMLNLNEGEILAIKTCDPGFKKDIEGWCERTGNTLLEIKKEDRCFVSYIKKGKEKEETKIITNGNNKTIVVFSGDLDKVIASFIIANGAKAMGRDVTMFFTFWGLSVLRKEKVKVKKNFIEKMFGKMLPKGSKKLKLSKMNMGGMGTKLIRKIMKDKNVSSLEELIQSGINSGINIVACSMSMDIMGIKKEELIDGVTIGGVGSYLAKAETSDTNLFI